MLVVLWTEFSGAFAAAVTTLYIPLTRAAFGSIARGAAFAYRKSVDTHGMRRFFGAALALSSPLTPFIFGAVVGGVASARVPPGIAAVFLCGDARRDGEHDLADAFRRRARHRRRRTRRHRGIAADAPLLFDGLTGRGLPWWCCR